MEKYRERSRYAARYGRRGMEIGAQTPQTGAQRSQTLDCNGNWVTDRGAHGRATEPGPRETEICEAKPPRCDCHVIGTNSLNVVAATGATLGLGIQSGAFGFLTIDSGDAGYFVPYYMAVFAFEASQTAGILAAGAGATPLVVTLQDSLSGREPNMRRASQSDASFGVATLIYGQEKELECVDWRQFASTNNQQMQLFWFNPNSVPVHVFVDIWGLPAA